MIECKYRIGSKVQKADQMVQQDKKITLCYQSLLLSIIDHIL